MKNISTQKGLVATSLILAAVGYAGMAAAHVKTGALGSAASATDAYKVTCSTGTARLMTQVKDNSPVAAPLVSVTASKGGAGTTSTDTNGDGNATHSPAVYLIKGTGVYDVYVKKSAAGAENYTLQYHCETSTGGHTETSITQTSNQ